VGDQLPSAALATNEKENAVKKSDFARFKETFEAAHGQQSPSPFSTLLSGRVDYGLVSRCLADWKEQSVEDAPLLDDVHQWLVSEVDPEEIENQQQIPDAYLQGLRRLGCMRARIPEENGGLGLSQCRYSRLLEKIGSWSEVLALVVSVQQLGVAQGLLSLKKLELRQGGEEERGEALRRRYLKRLAEDAIGAFCLTTPETGSDPSRMQTTAAASANGRWFILNGNDRVGGKLYTTLGTIADVYIMLAVVVYPGEDVAQVDPRERITAFLVDREYPGISVKPLQFCGWLGLPNAAIRLENVRVPKENILGEIGDGLKIAFMNLGSGRINIAAISLGMMKQLERIARWWSVERVQGGKPIGEHELNTDQLVRTNASIFAVESYLQFVSALADRPDSDIRLEAAMLKLFASHTLVDIADETLQLRGGRGYETYASQSLRGDTPVAVERLYRSARMMKIGEGGSNILQLYIMRCLLDDFLKDYKKLSQKGVPLWRKTIRFIGSGARYSKCYLLTNPLPKTRMPTVLRRHMRYVIKEHRRLVRLLLHRIAEEHRTYYRQRISSIVRKRPAKPIPKPDETFEQRQVLLGHCAQIAVALSVMTVTCLRAARDDDPAGIELADEFCTRMRETIAVHCMKIGSHSAEREETMRKRGTKIMQGDYANAVEHDIVRVDLPHVKD
jgi:alkylation response protein AidB-like acyl-CoA dehydrogenase